MGKLSVRLKVTTAALLGLAGGVVIGLALGWHLAPLAAWDLAATIYLIWTWLEVWSFGSGETAKHAVREDPGRATTDVLLLAASVASLVAVGFVITQASGQSGPARLLMAGFGIFSVVVSWALVHTVFTLKYAELYYVGKPGGIDFNETEPPRYADFAYLAFTIGMTFQVSDTNLETKVIRATALRHALLSYLFGTVIVATTINLIAGLSK